MTNDGLATMPPRDQEPLDDDSEGEEASPEECADDSTWSIAAQTELAPGFFAWDLLGIGRRFEMWIAWCAERMTPVCVKVPRQDQLDEQTVSALRREHEAASAMSHPAIPRVFGADFTAPIPYLVHEFIEGKPLSRVIKEDGRFGDQDLALLGLQLAAVLRHVHSRGFVHLDVKPSNVVLRGDRAVLLDFDIALPIGGQRSKTKPRGTRFYIPPEQIRCEPAAPTMDLFSLGATLYEAASGKRAFHVDTLDETTVSGAKPRRYGQLGEPIPKLTELAPDLLSSIAAVVDALLAPDAADRPPSASAVIRLLEDAMPPSMPRMWPPWVSDTIVATDG